MIKIVQSLSDKQHNYFGSARVYYSGVALGSTAAWNWVGFSGTNTGFGTHGNEECNRMTLAGSGNSICQWSFNSGASLAGELFGGDAFALDGPRVSGLWMRSSSASQLVQLWAW